MAEILLVLGLAVAVFVGFNIGGSSTGVAFGPAVGSETLSKTTAAVLMTGFALLGGWQSGREVVKTMGGDIVHSSEFTLAASVAVLFFVGAALLISNVAGVPASTSMTAVGAIAGLGVASGTIRWTAMGQIVSGWLVAPVVAFWVCAVVGRYCYRPLDRWLALESEGPGRTGRERLGAMLVIAIGCYMAYSAGASNIANAIAPLYGAGELSMTGGILLAGGAIGIGAFTIARRTMDTVGNGLTDLPILAALIVEAVSATIIVVLSEMGLPASLAVSATMCIVGLGWGRATRTVALSQAASAAVADGRADSASTTAADSRVQADGAPRPDEADPEGADGPTAADLFDPKATGRVIVLWILTPTVSATASFLVFRFIPGL